MIVWPSKITIPAKAKIINYDDRIVNYGRKERCKLKHTFAIVNYDCKTFMAQATALREGFHFGQVSL
jgi:hypothetical protein